MAQIIDFSTPENVREVAQDFNRKIDEQKKEQKSFFEEYLRQIEEINPQLGGFEEFSALLSLPDEQFALIAPIFLDELSKSFNNVEDKLMLVQVMNINGAKLEDLHSAYMDLIENIDSQFA